MTTARFGLAAGLGLIVVLAAAPGLGAQQRLSPPDSSELELAGRQIKVTFSSPSVRDRVIFGGLVPWNQVWRTGANEAQTGQWGTEYHPDMDLARVEMEVEELEEPVESFRIVLYPRGPDEGTLLLEWANTRTSVPFEVLR